MGCFSFLCNVCERPINSNSHSGQRCTLYLIEKGELLEEMTGQYDSYGHVFNEQKESVEWQTYPWSEYVEGAEDGGKNVCDLMFDHDPTSGIVAVHERCKRKKFKPTTQSDSDPEQGWGRYKKTDDYSCSHVVYKKSDKELSDE